MSSIGYSAGLPCFLSFCGEPLVLLKTRPASGDDSPLMLLSRDKAEVGSGVTERESPVVRFPLEMDPEDEPGFLRRLSVMLEIEPVLRDGTPSSKSKDGVKLREELTDKRRILLVRRLCSFSFPEWTL